MQSVDLGNNILTAIVCPLSVWRVSLFLVLVASVIFMMKNVPISRLGRVFWGYVLIYSLCLFEFPYPMFGGWSRAFESTAGQTFAQATLIPIIVIFWPKLVIKSIPFLALIECASVWIFGAGLMQAPSFDTAFIALCLPFMRPWMCIAGLITICTHHGSTALLIVVAQCLAYAFVTRKWKPVLSLAAVTLIAFLFHGGFALGADSRIQAWHRFMDFWAKSPNRIAFGQGPGTFMWSSIMIDNFKAPIFLCMHNDWLQITFETGLIGLILAIGFTAETIWKVRRSRQLLPLILGATVFGTFYHPLRFAGSALTVALIFRLALIKEEIHFKIPAA